MNRFSRLGVILAATAAAVCLFQRDAQAQAWSEPVRGSWVRDGDAQNGDVVLADKNVACQVVVRDDAHSAVKQAATFLASDLNKLSGQKHHFNDTAPPSGTPSIRLVTLGDGTADLPAGIKQDALKGKWEAYQILTQGDTVWCVGSDARGTAFAVYALSERLGIDPLYIWSGATPTPRERLVLRRTDEFANPPTFKYRGMFHDDEDILPRPFEYSGYPLRIGDVPLEWYKRFFETALRLRMNMVAPYTRVHRRFEVQKTASDWGLFYTSHHYDILLSNPFGYGNFKLAEKRGVTGAWDWISNKENMLKYWRAGVEENGALDCIWPVGLRGTDDVGYSFPKDMPEAEQNKIFQEVINAQRDATHQLVPEAKRPPVFHFTLYGEMLDKFLAGGGKFDMPDDVIIIWPDDNDGRIRALPKEAGKWKHGVYYHLAYWGPVAKQSMRVVPARRIATEFKKIVEGGATEYMLLNVSELREFIREARMIGEISWDAKTALRDTELLPLPDPILPHVPTELPKDRPLPPDTESPSADRFRKWFAAEYFGDGAAEAAEAYRLYDDLLHRWDHASWAGDHIPRALNTLRKKMAGEPFDPVRETTLPALREFEARARAANEAVDRAAAKMTREQRQFFFENCGLPLSAVWKHAQAALLVVEAIGEKDNAKAFAMCEQAMKPLEDLEGDLRRAERPPFEGWYRDTYIRHEHTGHSMRHPYYALRAFVTSGGKGRLEWPEAFRRPYLPDFLPLLKEKF